ncbi:hypothetical protein OGAPHI_005102 [Ogataea philodendri]|uniref:Membrane anchor Opy2 N-terminal domain-containing protein n=1 Tax=Ogataea philodendri TaxID=1378263 RepID=A0A9P8P2B3_9ASCO|nr:uncharacterized protein OGAPHI_005102 [Ogataea philodendri]KAH3663701.1 hypothetical protein OGAPHI_005102 [Ogataea philodendri]
MDFYYDPHEGVYYEVRSFIFERGDNSTDCVSCTDSLPACPQCAETELCLQTSRTCSACPTRYCANSTTSSASSSASATTKSSSLSSAKVGGIAGGVAAFAFLILVGLFYVLYKKWYKKRYPYGFFYYFEDDDDEQDKEQFIGDQVRQRRNSQSTLTTVANSVLTKASNVINVTYIPGVTTRNGSSRLTNSRAGGSSNGSNRAMSVYSKETYFSDLEAASIHGGNVITRGGIPRLVNVEEDAYDYEAPKNRFVLEDTILEGEESEEDEPQYGTGTGSNTGSNSKTGTSGGTNLNLGPLVLRNNDDVLGSSDESDLGDSDEENIEYLTTQHMREQADSTKTKGDTVSLDIPLDTLDPADSGEMLLEVDLDVQDQQQNPFESPLDLQEK